MATQSEDFKWFVENHNRLVDVYKDKHIVIQDNEVICTGDTFEDALNNALVKGLEVGTFIIQECTEGESGYTQSFSSRVIFA